MVQASVLKARSAEATRAVERPLRLAMLASKPTGIAPGQRFRLEQWTPRVAARHAITIDLFPFESPPLMRILNHPGHVAEKAAWVGLDFVRRARHVVAASRYDGVVVYREIALLGPAIYERALTRLGVPLFLDFDDAIWTEGATLGPNGLFAKLRFAGKTRTICRLASGVLAGNHYLADWSRQFNDNVFVVPTSIELEKYAVQPELPSDDPFVVVWTGSTTTLAHFECGREALERLAAKRRLVVKVICNTPPARPVAGAETVYVPWTEKGEAEAVGAAHVGIMPLPDDVYTRGKCGLKALQYMATGRPVVISPVGMNKDLVEHGVNGFLAGSVDEWVAALEQLAASPELRRRVGAAGRRTVEERYSADVVSATFARAIRETLAKHSHAI